MKSNRSEVITRKAVKDLFLNNHKSWLSCTESLEWQSILPTWSNSVFQLAPEGGMYFSTFLKEEMKSQKG